MSDTLLRQWNMLQHIPRAPQKISTPDIVEKLIDAGFSVTARTVQRDLEKLSSIFPFTADSRSRPFGWQWIKDAQLTSLPGMDLRTALTLKLVERFLLELIPKQALTELSPYLNQASNVLKSVEESPYARWNDIVEIAPIGQKLLPAEIDPVVVDTVYEALFIGKRLKAHYHHKPTNTQKDYGNINPLGLIIRAGVIRLVCTFFDYQDIHQLALHRITKAEIIDTDATQIEGFSLQNYVNEDHAMDFPLDGGKEFKLVILIEERAGFHLMETPLSKDQVISKTEDGRLRVTATLPYTAQLRWWLLGFADQLEVVKPVKLRRMMADTISRMAAQYR